MNDILFKTADFLSRPPGFYLVLLGMAAATLLVPLGFTAVVTYALSMFAIVITGIVLIQGYRDTAAIHAKLDELVLSLKEPRSSMVGLEHEDPDDIREELERLEAEAGKAAE